MTVKFYVDDVVTLASRGDEHFVVVQLPSYSGGGYYVREAYNDEAQRIYVTVANMTLVRPGPNRPKDDVVRESKRAKKEREERVNALLDARSSFIALYDTLPDGAMRELIGDLRDEAERKLREMAE